MVNFDSKMDDFDPKMPDLILEWSNSDPKSQLGRKFVLAILDF